MKLKQELEEIKNKDLSNMTTEELLTYKSELTQKANNSTSKTKVGLKKALYTVVSYIFGAGIGYCAARVLMTYIYTGSLAPFLPNLGLALLCGVPIAGSYVFFKLAKRNAQKITQVCNNKLLEVDKQIAVNDYKRQLELSHSVQKSDAQVVRTDESTVFDLSNNNTKKEDQGIER